MRDMMMRVSIVLCCLCLVATQCYASESTLSLRNHHFESESIKDTEVADLLGHLFMSAPVHTDADRSAYPRLSVADLSGANLLVVLESLTVDTVEKILSKDAFLAQGERISIEQSEKQLDALAYTATLMTGELSKVHGIVHNEWVHSVDNQNIHLQAFDYEAESIVASVFDVLAQSSDSMSVSMSGDWQLASAIAPRTSFRDETHSYYAWDSNCFVNSASGVSVCIDDIMAAVESGLFDVAEGVTTSVADNVLSVSFDGTVAEFALDEMEDVAMIAEVFGINLLKEVERSTVGGDVYTVGVSSLNHIVNKYGRRSTQFTASLKLVDAALADLHESLEKKYNTVSSEILFEAPSDKVTHRFSRAVLDDSNTTYTENQVADYQTAVWSSVFLAIAVAITVYALFSMDVGDDSIFRATAAPRSQ